LPKRRRFPWPGETRLVFQAGVPHDVLRGGRPLLSRGVKTMRNACVVLVALAVLALGGRSPGEDKSAPAEDRLAPLEPFVGEWVVDGKWSSGESLHARSVYQWGLGKKILKAQTFVGEGDKEYQRYEGVMAWHPDKKCLYEISFAFDGALSEYLIEVEGKDTLHLGR